MPKLRINANTRITQRNRVTPRSTMKNMTRVTYGGRLIGKKWVTAHSTPMSRRRSVTSPNRDDQWRCLLQFQRYLLNVFWHWFRYGEYIGNTYGPGTGKECLSTVACDGTETVFKDCKFSIVPHDDPSRDVSVCCYPGKTLRLSITLVFLLRVCSAVISEQCDFR